MVTEHVAVDESDRLEVEQRIASAVAQQPRGHRAATHTRGQDLDVGVQVRGGHGIGVGLRAARSEEDKPDNALHGFTLSTQPNATAPDCEPSCETGWHPYKRSGTNRLFICQVSGSPTTRLLNKMLTARSAAATVRDSSSVDTRWQTSTTSRPPRRGARA